MAQILTFLQTAVSLSYFSILSYFALFCVPFFHPSQAHRRGRNIFFSHQNGMAKINIHSLCFPPNQTRIHIDISTFFLYILRDEKSF